MHLYTKAHYHFPVVCPLPEILAGWPLRNPVTASRSSRHQSKNRPIFFARSRSSLVFKPFTVFAITESAYSTWTPLGEREKNFLISLLHRHLTKIVLLSLLADTDHDLPESCGYTTSINRHAKNQSHAKTVTNLPHESRLDTRYYFNVRSKAEISQLIICHTEPTTLLKSGKQKN